MPEWGWICVGLSVLGGFVLVVAAFQLWSFSRKVGREHKLVDEEGETVVGKIVIATSSLYERQENGLFEGAFVVFTRDCDASAAHLDALDEIIARLKRFEPDEGNPEQEMLAEALDTQKSINTVIKLPKRISRDREAFFASPAVDRDLLDGKKLTRDYLYVRFLHRKDVSFCKMVAYPQVAKRVE